MMPLPHALESLLSLLVAIRQDSASDVGLSSSLSLRQSYSAAIIRLVNGLVDPLQTGAYARPIQSIATQIGLPAWLVELRHAATHEDLPSLELLRDGAKEVSPSLAPSYTADQKNKFGNPVLFSL
jgi:ribosomal biogenesis protein LAS1